MYSSRLVNNILIIYFRTILTPPNHMSQCSLVLFKLARKMWTWCRKIYCWPVILPMQEVNFVTASKRLSTTGKPQAESSPVRPLIVFYLLLFLLIILPLRIVTNFLVVGQAENKTTGLILITFIYKRIDWNRRSQSKVE